MESKSCVEIYYKNKLYAVTGNTIGEIKINLSKFLDTNPENICLLLNSQEIVDNSVNVKELNLQKEVYWGCVVLPKNINSKFKKHPIATCCYCKKEVTNYTWEWISGNPCDADYDNVCSICKEEMRI